VIINGPISFLSQRLAVCASFLCACKSPQSVAPKEKNPSTTTTSNAASYKVPLQAAVFDAKECPTSLPSATISKIDMVASQGAWDCVESEQRLSTSILCQFAKSLQTLALFSAANTLIFSGIDAEAEDEQAKEIRRGWKPAVNGEIEIEENGMFVHKRIGARTVFYCFEPDEPQSRSYTLRNAGEIVVDHFDEKRQPTAVPK
jgi:hypothetical protein